MVHSCPRCELRFLTRAELTDHLGDDHGLASDRLERYHYRDRSGATVARDGAPGDDRRRYLIVANQTLHADEMVDRIRVLAGAGPARFTVVVPATTTAGHVAPVAVSSGLGADPDGAALAAWRLRHLLDVLDAEGITAEGQVGDPDPFRAVSDVVRRQGVDEVVVGTLPTSLSRWMAADLPRRIEHQLNLPVSRVEAAGREPDPKGSRPRGSGRPLRGGEDGTPRPERRRVSSGSPYERAIGFSRAVRAGNRVLVSGTGPVRPDGTCPDDAGEQARRCLEIVAAALAEAGAGLDDVVRTRMFITTPADADAVGAVHAQHFGASRPAATMVVVAALLDPRWKVEIEAEAVVAP